MRYVVTGGEMKRADTYTIDTIGIPSMVLMERAALAVAEELKRGDFSLERVLVICGIGNNGGDGLAAARLLHLEGVDVTVFLAGDPARGSEQFREQYRILRYYQVPETDNITDREYTTIVDAIFGVGLSRDVKGSYAEMIETVNRMPAKVMAVDISSGIHADTGAVMGTAVKADATVTFAFEKAGQLLYPGAEYSGRVVVADIGITKEAFEEDFPKLTLLESCDMEAYLARTPRSNKGTYGKVLAAAGHRGVAGAAFLSAAGAYHTGCGLVKIFTEESNREILQTLLPEAMTDTFRAGSPDEELLEADIAWADAVVFGPGIGTGEEAQRLFAYVWKNCEKPLVLDADGITLLARAVHGDGTAGEEQSLCREEGAGEEQSLHREEAFAQEQAFLLKARPKGGLVITPHPGELARLMGKTVPEITEDIPGWARRAAKRFDAVCILKDARTVTASPDGRAVINITGNSGMATGGSGDVLAGVVAALLARGTVPFEAAAAGVRLHGMAGDLAAREKGERGMLAGDLLAYLGNSKE